MEGWTTRRENLSLSLPIDERVWTFQWQPQCLRVRASQRTSENTEGFNRKWTFQDGALNNGKTYLSASIPHWRLITCFLDPVNTVGSVDIIIKHHASCCKGFGIVNQAALWKAHHSNNTHQKWEIKRSRNQYSLTFLHIFALLAIKSNLSRISNVSHGNISSL